MPHATPDERLVAIMLHVALGGNWVWREPIDNVADYRCVLAFFEKLQPCLVGIEVVVYYGPQVRPPPMSRSLLNIAKRSLLRLMLSCVGLASKHAV